MFTAMSRRRITTKDTKDTKVKPVGFPLCPSCPLWLINVEASKAARKN